MSKPELNEVFTYTIAEPNDDPKLVVIEKSGIKARFTLEEVMANTAIHQKKRKELLAMREVTKAKMDNVARNHPDVMALEPVKRIAARIYEDNREVLEAVDAKLAEFDEQMASDAREVADIAHQTGVVYSEPVADKPPVADTAEAPTAPVEGAVDLVEPKQE